MVLGCPPLGLFFLIQAPIIRLAIGSIRLDYYAQDDDYSSVKSPYGCSRTDSFICRPQHWLRLTKRDSGHWAGTVMVHVTSVWVYNIRTVRAVYRLR